MGISPLPKFQVDSSGGGGVAGAPGAESAALLCENKVLLLFFFRYRKKFWQKFLPISEKIQDLDSRFGKC